MKGNFPIDKFQDVATPFYYYDTELLLRTLKAINDEAGKHEGFVVHYAIKANANPKVLEPVYDVEVMVPGDVMGDVMSDLQGRRAIIMGMSSENGFEKLSAKVPLKEMSSYSTALSSITGGRSSFTMKYSSYELVPGDVQEKLLKEYAEKNSED